MADGSTRWSLWTDSLWPKSINFHLSPIYSCSPTLCSCLFFSLIKYFVIKIIRIEFKKFIIEIKKKILLVLEKVKLNHQFHCTTIQILFFL